MDSRTKKEEMKEDKTNRLQMGDSTERTLDLFRKTRN